MHIISLILKEMFMQREFVPCQNVVVHPSIFLTSSYQQQTFSDFLQKVPVCYILFCTFDKGDYKTLSFYLVGFKTIILLKIKFCLIYSHLWGKNLWTSVENTPKWLYTLSEKNDQLLIQVMNKKQNNIICITHQTIVSNSGLLDISDPQ